MQSALMKELREEVLGRKKRFTEQMEDDSVFINEVEHMGEMESAHGKASVAPSGKDLHLHKSKQDKEKVLFMAGDDHMSCGSPLKSKRNLRHHNTQDTSFPSHNDIPTSPDREKMPTRSLTQEVTQSSIATEHKSPQLPTTASKPQKKSAVKHRNTVGVDGHKLATPHQTPGAVCGLNAEEAALNSNKDEASQRSMSDGFAVCGHARGKGVEKERKSHRKVPLLPPAILTQRPALLMEEKVESIETKPERMHEDVSTETSGHEDKENKNEDVLNSSNLPPPHPNSQLQLPSISSPRPIAKIRNSSNSSSRNAESALTTLKSAKDGGMVLIVKPSPSSTQRLPRTPIIFKLPPPPPLPLGVDAGLMSGGTERHERAPDAVLCPTSPEMKEKQVVDSSEATTRVTTSFEATGTSPPLPSTSLETSGTHQVEDNIRRVEEAAGTVAMLESFPGRTENQTDSTPTTTLFNSHSTSHSSNTDTSLEQNSKASHLSCIVSPGGGLVNFNSNEIPVPDDHASLSNQENAMKVKPASLMSGQLHSGGGAGPSQNTLTVADPSSISMSNTDASQDGHLYDLIERTSENKCPTTRRLPKHSEEGSRARAFSNPNTSPIKKVNMQPGSSSNRSSPRKSPSKRKQLTLLSADVAPANADMLLNTSNNNRNNSKREIDEEIMEMVSTRTDDPYLTVFKGEGKEEHILDSESGRSLTSKVDVFPCSEGDDSLMDVRKNEHGVTGEGEATAADESQQEKLVKCGLQDRDETVQDSRNDCMDDTAMVDTTESMELSDLDNLLANLHDLVESFSSTEGDMNTPLCDDIEASEIGGTSEPVWKDSRSMGEMTDPFEELDIIIAPDAPDSRDLQNTVSG